MGLGELDQRVFAWLWRGARRVLGRDAHDAALPDHAARLAELAPRLSLLASALAGCVLDVRAGEHGWSREQLFVPESLALAATREANEHAYLLLVAWLVILRRHGWQLAAPGQDARAAGRRQRVLDELREQLPGAAALDTLPSEALFEVAVVAREAASSPPLARADDTPEGQASVHEGRMPSELRHVELDERQDDANPLVHSFEQLRTAENYQAGRKAIDGSDELDEQLEALRELDLRELVRTRERAGSLLRVDLLIEGGPESGDVTPTRAPDFVYDEWDARTRSYRAGHCKLYVEQAGVPAPADASAWLREVELRRRGERERVRARLDRLARTREPKPRQREGGSIDLDALVDAHASLRAGVTPDERLYVHERAAAPSLALMILLDLSLSSDAWLAGQRVLDVSRESLLVVGDALHERGVMLGIAGFASHTRHDCRFVVIKPFSRDWAHCRARLAGLRPRGYTRIGPALRHAITTLAPCPVRRRAILVLSDGQPTDFDRYEGRHGIADVHRAVEEAQARGIGCFALALANLHRPALASMFGRDRYALLPHPGRLPEALGELLGELVEGS